MRALLFGNPVCPAVAASAAFGARALHTQIRALAKLSWFFLTGTTAQLVAIGIVVYELLKNPDPEAKTELVRVSGHYERQFVAIFNMVFAYGGQFAFTGEQQRQQQMWQQWFEEGPASDGHLGLTDV